MSKLGSSVNIILSEMQEAKRQGDNNALNYGFKELYDLMYEYLSLFSAYHLYTSQDADDCALLALEKAFKSIKRFNPNKDGSNWILQAARNAVRDMKKKKLRELRRTVSLEKAQYYIHAQSYTEEQLIEKADLHKALDRLPEDDRKMVKYHCIDKYTLDEVAKMMKLSKSTVFEHIKKSIFTLKEILEENRTK